MTASEQARQRRLPFGTADSPRGADAEVEAGRPAAATVAVPKPKVTKRTTPPAMTMEEVACEANLIEAFWRVASNDGAAGPDRQSLAEVRKHLGTTPGAFRESASEGEQPAGQGQKRRAESTNYEKQAKRKREQDFSLCHFRSLFNPAFSQKCY